MSISHSHETEAHSHELGFLRKYIFSEDHKTIGIQFLFSGIIFLFIGGAALSRMANLPMPLRRWIGCKALTVKARFVGLLVFNSVHGFPCSC